jgi:hypothetical protein
MSALGTLKRGDVARGVVMQIRMRSRGPDIDKALATVEEISFSYKIIGDNYLVRQALGIASLLLNCVCSNKVDHWYYYASLGYRKSQGDNGPLVM